MRKRNYTAATQKPPFFVLGGFFSAKLNPGRRPAYSLPNPTVGGQLKPGISILLT
jgi:hypothetical protein